tara:strand:+ start:144 stop:470 length:327 start_codon:yes stop_codon:yes gene_type:complete
MTPPCTVKVNGRVVSIKYRASKHMPELAGQFHPEHCQIDINKGQELQELQDTVLHETLHAILHTQGREYGGDVEELYVRALATGLCGVLKDNPEFTLWMLQPSPSTNH